MADPRARTIKIKSGVLKRMGKEREANHKEYAQQFARIEKMKAEGKDPYDIKKQFEVLEECKMMFPNTQKRLEAAHAELKGLLETEKDLAETGEYKEAATILAEVPLEDPRQLQL
eukprot:m.40452 g.40452  ORF g.40452 m.40452 type:complete len:115 (-) comp10326_c0_seq1:28-372(-)